MQIMQNLYCPVSDFQLDWATFGGFLIWPIKMEEVEILQQKIYFFICTIIFIGAFLIPYWISVLIAGLPFYFLELAIGQYSSLGPNVIFVNLAPIALGNCRQF